MKFKQLLTKSLLVAVCLLAGQSVWGKTTTYNFQSFISNALNANKDLVTGDASGVTLSNQGLKILSDMNSTNYETRGDKTEAQKSPYYLTFNGRFAASGDFQLNRASGYGIRTTKSNAYRYFAVLNLNAGDKITFNYESANQIVFTFFSDNVTGKSVGDNVESGVEYTMSKAGHLDLQTTKNTGARLQSIVINSEIVSSPSVGTATNVNTTTGERTLPITAGVSDAENTVTTYWSATTELTSENYSTAGTEVVANSIVTTSDVIYLISVSSTGICSAGITSEASDWGITWDKTASVSLNSVTNHNGWLSSPVFTITGPEGHTSLAYTFTPDGGEESSKTNITSGSTYKPTEKGVLTVYANSTGYSPSTYTIPVSNIYASSYSTDFTAYTESPFGNNSSDVTNTWWTTAYRSTASSSTTLGRLRFGVNGVTDLVIGYGVGRKGSDCPNMQIRRAIKGNIETLTIKNNSSTGVTSGTYNTYLLETSGSGAETELSSKFNVTANHTIAQHYCSSPVIDAVLSAILDCETYETSSDFATAIEAESFSTTAEVYAFHTAWQIENASGNDITKVIFDAPVSDFSRWNNARSNSNQQYTGAPDNKYFDAWDKYVSDAKQKIYGLPAGTYSLKVATRASEDLSDKSKYNVWVSGGSANVSTLGNHDGNTGGELGNGWSWTIIPFTLDAKADVEIGFYSLPGEGSNLWAGADDWHLYKLPENVSKNISDAGWATYCSPYALDLSNATGLTDAYIVTGGSNGVLTKSSVKGGTVPANTGLLLKGNEGTATIPVVATSETDVTGNILKGVTEATVIDAESGWVLMGSPKLGFYQNAAAFTVGANTAYILVSDLPVPPAPGAARASYLLFDDMTGISQVAGSEVKTNGVIYNLNGQRVSNPTKGIYIIDGVKVAIE